jgi:integrase
MARHKRSSQLETRAARLRLKIQRKPYFIQIAPRVGLGYRRNQKAPGTWVARGPDGHGSYWTRAFGTADDHEDADGNSILNFWMAQDRAKEIVRGKVGGVKPVTVAEALEAYKADLTSRGGSARNYSRVASNIPSTLAARPVALLASKELRHWRDQMIARGIKASTADRTSRMMKAALNLAARDDPRIQSSAWKSGLQRLPEQETPPNKILDDITVRKIVAAAHRHDPIFGLVVEVLAVTGSRPSQVLRLEVGDLRDGPSPSLLMPSSRKGKRRRITRTPLPIPSSLGKALKRHAGDRDQGEPLFAISYDFLRRRWLEVMSEIGVDAVIYSLRHSSVVRQILANVPTRVVAAVHDTSTMVLEHVYSRYIGTVSDSVVRASLIDMSGDGS